MTQTAVEWLFEQIVNRTDRIYFLKELEQAKQMDMEQNYNLDNLRDAYRWGTTVSIGTSDHFEEFLHNIKKK